MKYESGYSAECSHFGREITYYHAQGGLKASPECVDRLACLRYCFVAKTTTG